MNKIGAFFNWLYEAFLWLLGFAQNEKITFMLRRQKERLGCWWWVLSGGTIAGLIALLLHVIGVF